MVASFKKVGRSSDESPILFIKGQTLLICKRHQVFDYVHHSDDHCGGPWLSVSFNFSPNEIRLNFQARCEKMHAQLLCCMVSQYCAYL